MLGDNDEVESMFFWMVENHKLSIFEFIPTSSAQIVTRDLPKLSLEIWRHVMDFSVV